MYDTSVALADFDPELALAVHHEARRQEDHVELIASENYASPLVMAIQNSVFTNKYAEGYPGKRYYSGCEHVDVAERLEWLTKPCHRRTPDRRFGMHGTKSEQGNQFSTVQEDRAAATRGNALAQGRPPAGQRRDGAQRHPVRAAHRHSLGGPAPRAGLWQRHDLLEATT